MFSFSFTQHETAHNGIVNRPQELLLFSLLPVILSYSRPTTGSVVASVWPHVHRPVWRHPSITLLFSLRLIIPLLSKAWFVTPSVSRSHFSLGERDRRRNETGRQLENEEGKWRVLGETSKRHFQRKDERRRKKRENERANETCGSNWRGGKSKQTTGQDIQEVIQKKAEGSKAAGSTMVAHLLVVCILTHSFVVALAVIFYVTVIFIQYFFCAHYLLLLRVVIGKTCLCCSHLGSSPRKRLS